jgi:hypothetical protein
MSLAGKCMEIEIITLSEISQTQKDKYHKFLSYKELRKKETDMKVKKKKSTIKGVREDKEEGDREAKKYQIH